VAVLKLGSLHTHYRNLLVNIRDHKFLLFYCLILCVCLCVWWLVLKDSYYTTRRERDQPFQVVSKTRLERPHLTSQAGVVHHPDVWWIDQPTSCYSPHLVRAIEMANHAHTWWYNMSPLMTRTWN